MNEKDNSIENLLRAVFGNWYDTNQSSKYCENHFVDPNKKLQSEKKECDCTNKKETTNKYPGYKAENITEDGIYKGIRLMFAVPGLEKEDISVSVTNNIINVVGKKSVFLFGNLDTKIKIGFDVLVKNVKSKYNNGLLTIEVLKEIVKEESTIINID